MRTGAKKRILQRGFREVDVRWGQVCCDGILKLVETPVMNLLHHLSLVGGGRWIQLNSCPMRVTARWSTRGSKVSEVSEGGHYNLRHSVSLTELRDKQASKGSAHHTTILVIYSIGRY